MNSDETRLTAQLVQSVEHGTLNPRVVGSSPMLGSCSTYWASLVGQLVKLLAMREACIRFLDWGRSPGEGTGYPFQYSWASLVAQLVKNLLTMRETWVQSLG